MPHSRPKSQVKPLSACQIRIMGAMEVCKRLRMATTLQNIRMAYVEVNGTEHETDAEWHAEATELTTYSSIFEFASDGSWALTAWRTVIHGRYSGGARTIAGSPVIGESGAENVKTFGGK